MHILRYKLDYKSSSTYLIEVLSLLSNYQLPFSYHMKMADLSIVHFLVKQIAINSEKCIEYRASSGSQIDKPQCGCSKRAELLDVNINTDAQSINTEKASLSRE